MNEWGAGALCDLINDPHICCWTLTVSFLMCSSQGQEIAPLKCVHQGEMDEKSIA